jgi:hypothetical protein
MKLLGISLYVLTSLVSTGAGVGLWLLHPKPGIQIVPFGRDAAIIEAIGRAKKSVLIRTERFELCEIATELVNLKGVSVTVEIPQEAAMRAREDAMRATTAQLGISWKVGEEPTEAYRGTLIVIDDDEVISSASGLSYAPPLSKRPYVTGKLRGNPWV